MSAGVVASAEQAGAAALRHGATWQWFAQGAIALLAALLVIVQPAPPVAYFWLTFAAVAWIGSALRDLRLLQQRARRRQSGPDFGQRLELDTGHAFHAPALLVVGLVRTTALVLLVWWVAVDALDTPAALFVVVLAFLEALLTLMLVDIVRVIVVARAHHKHFLHHLWEVPESALAPTTTTETSGFFGHPRMWTLDGTGARIVVGPNDEQTIELDDTQ